MLLIYIGTNIIHDMHTGNTYHRHEDSVEIVSAAQHDDRNHMMPNLVCADDDAAIFWDWLKSQSLVPKQRTNPQPAPANDAPEPRKWKVGDKVKVTRAVIEDDANYLGKTGVVTTSEDYGEIFVDFDGDETMMVPDQLETAD